MDFEENKIPISWEVDIAVARLAGGELARQAGFGTIQTHCIVTSISELSANIFFHAGQGTIDLRIITRDDGVRGIEVTAMDEGQGIEDVDLALQDGSSTNGGLGGGLPGVNRLMSEMTISSAVGKGTVVRAVKWVREDRSPVLSFAEMR